MRHAKSFFLLKEPYSEKTFKLHIPIDTYTIWEMDLVPFYVRLQTQVVVIKVLKTFSPPHILIGKSWVQID